MAVERKRSAKGLALLAIDKLERLGCEPLAEIVEAMKYAKKKTIEGGNIDENGRSDQSQFLALWIKSAETLAKFKHPTLSAIAIQDISESDKDKRVMTARDAIEVIKRDPFSPSSVKNISTEKVLDAMEETGKMLPKLPEGYK